MAHPLIDLPTAKNGAIKTLQDEVFVFPATVGQQGFWYLDQLDRGNPAYNIAVRFRLEGPLQHAALVRAMNEILRRHESLRTVVMDIDGNPVQVVTPSLSIQVPVVDLRDVPAAERHSRSQLLTVEEARERFDLAVGPLIRASLLRLDEQVHMLLLTVHHVISDGWSIGVITQELGALYAAYCQGLSSPLAELPIQYGDFAVWQKRWLESAVLEGQLSYWKDKLAHLPLLEIKADRPRPAIQTSNGYIESLVLPEALTDALKGISNRQGVTFFMLALAALKVLLMRHTAQSDVFVGTLVAGRPRVELEPLIGLFVNPLVLRTDLSGNPTFLELLARVRSTVVEAFANQEVPFERVVEVVQPKRDPSRHPVFQINFIYQRDFVRPLQAFGLTLTAVPSMSPGAIYDLNFFMVERADGWRASCEYNTDLYQAATINHLLAQLQTLLQGIAANPSWPIAEIPMVTLSEREAWMPSPAAVRRPIVREPQRDGPSASSVAPRDETEARLVELWEQVLGIKDISIAADFFDEGGTSLLAARLFSKIERAFNKRISLVTLLQSPTIQALAEHLRTERLSNLRQQVFPIQSEGTKVPLVLQTGQPHIWRHLVRLLGPQQPVYGLFFPEITSLPNPFNVTDIAAKLIESLRHLQPNGPYLLGGWCRSGIIVYEMAQQLRARGDEVSLIVLFDTYSPPYLRSFAGLRAFPIRLHFLVQKLLTNIKRLRSRATREIVIKKTRAHFARWWASISRIWNRRSNDDQREDVAYGVPDQYLVVENYEPAPYDGRVLLFRSELYQTGRFRDLELGWGKLVRGGLDVQETPGDHNSMFVEPAAQVVAAKLTESLSQAVLVHPH
jgi:thioesterase domain-containing protein/acyl carrier protein